ncbi:MAG: arginine--tRNA ligase [Eubacteriaceae bacterium]|nr:arginine--tRNA ligase [Eubacteriaceae bacterium]
MQLNLSIKSRLDAENALKAEIANALESLFNGNEEITEALNSLEIEIETPKDASFGDFSTNVAMKFAKTAKMAPKALAEALIGQIDCQPAMIRSADIAGPGFINFTMAEELFASYLINALEQKGDYGKVVLPEKKRLNMEYVSANPTGPLHIGNARGGAIGDTLASIFEWAGWEVTREFYLNDAGNQILKLSESIYARAMDHIGKSFPFPDDGYKGEDVIDLAIAFSDLYPGFENGEPREVMEQMAAFALEKNSAAMEQSLAGYNIHYDVWFKESSLHSNGAISKAVSLLGQNNATYEQGGAIWFKATEYGCDKDEVLIRSNGVPTYYAADLAYHLDKLVERKFDLAINIWGADHHGHVKRLQMALAAAGIDPARLQIVIMQLVLVTGVRQSKRKGDIFTLSDLVEDVGVDATRFTFNSFSPSTHMDFDLELAKQQSNENPVFYVQYAHARMCSIIRNLLSINEKGLAPPDPLRLVEKQERALIKLISSFSKEIAMAATELDSSRIAKYAYDLATCFHSFYNSCRVISEDEVLMASRLALVEAAKHVLHSSLSIVGITAPESM